MREARRSSAKTGNDGRGRAERTEVKQMNENSDIIFVPDDSASHEWTERDSELVEEYAAQLMSMSI